jgi:hypothetical protein
MRVLGLGLGLAMLAGGALAQSGATPVPVGGGNGAACPDHGTSSAAAEVRVGPGDSYEVLDHLKAGEGVFVCASAKGFYGIVYGLADCGVNKPVMPRQGYIGACKTGWVATKQLSATAE